MNVCSNLVSLNFKCMQKACHISFSSVLLVSCNCGVEWKLDRQNPDALWAMKASYVIHTCFSAFSFELWGNIKVCFVSFRSAGVEHLMYIKEDLIIPHVSEVSTTKLMLLKNQIFKCFNVNSSKFYLLCKTN